jgi:hypothetical protein
MFQKLIFCQLKFTNFLIKKYIDITTENAQSQTRTSNNEEDNEAPNLPVKSWNFPKIHLRQHLFDDIINKGVARNFSTKPNERMHGPIRKSYHRRTNFKDFGDQVCHFYFNEILQVLIMVVRS